MPILLKITTDGNRVRATASGKIVEQCTGTANAFNLTESKIKSALQEIDYRNDYQGFMLTGYTKTLTPESDEVEIISEQVEPLIIANDTLRNSTRSETATYTSNLTHQVTNTVSVTWSSTDQISAGFEIGCKLNISGTTHLDFTKTTGTDLQRSKSVVVGASRGVSVQLGPGKKVLASLQVNRRVLKLKVPYRVDIGGSVAGCYGSNRTRNYDMKDVLEAAGKRTTRRVTATVVIDCYTDANIDLSNV